MPDVLIRNIDDKTLERLKQSAKQNQRSLQAELKTAIEQYALPTPDEVMKAIRKIRKDFETKNTTFPDSTDEIRKMRDSR